MAWPHPLPTEKLPTVAPPALQARVRRMVDQHGMKSTCRALGLSGQAVANVLAGVKVHAGTIALADQRAPR